MAVIGPEACRKPVRGVCAVLANLTSYAQDRACNEVYPSNFFKILSDVPAGLYTFDQTSPLKRSARKLMQ